MSLVTSLPQCIETWLSPQSAPAPLNFCQFRRRCDIQLHFISGLQTPGELEPRFRSLLTENVPVCQLPHSPHLLQLDSFVCHLTWPFCIFKLSVLYTDFLKENDFHEFIHMQYLCFILSISFLQIYCLGKTLFKTLGQGRTMYQQVENFVHICAQWGIKAIKLGGECAQGNMGVVAVWKWQYICSYFTAYLYEILKNKKLNIKKHANKQESTLLANLMT